MLAGCRCYTTAFCIATTAMMIPFVVKFVGNTTDVKEKETIQPQILGVVGQSILGVVGQSMLGVVGQSILGVVGQPMLGIVGQSILGVVGQSIFSPCCLCR